MKAIAVSLLLLAAPAAVMAAPAPLREAIPPVCQDVANIASGGALGSAFSGDHDYEMPDVPDDEDEFTHFVGRLILPGGVTGYLFGGSSGDVGVYSTDRRRIAINRDPDVDWDENEHLRWAEPVGVHHYGGEDYIVWANGPDTLEYVSKIDQGSLHRVVCEFSPTGTPLSRYEAFVRDAREAFKTPWQVALETKGIETTKMLLAHDADPTRMENGYLLLSEAMRLERSDILGVLLEAGADPNAVDESGRTSFQEAVRFEQTSSAFALLRAGVRLDLDPSEVMGLVAKSPVEGRRFVAEYLERYGRITEQTIWAAATTQVFDLLPELERSKLPVVLESTYWRAGRRLSTPPFLTQYLAAQPERLARVDYLFARGTRPPKTGAVSVYSGGTDWWVHKAAGSVLTDDDFLMFSTSFCVHFLSSVNCGPTDLTQRAAQWLAKISLPCSHERSRKELDEPACRVSMEYKAIATNELDSFVTITQGKLGEAGALTLGLNQLCDLYVQKHLDKSP